MVLDEARPEVETHWVEFVDILVPWVPEADMPEVQTTMLMAADETVPARYYTVPKEVQGQLHGDEINGGMAFLFSMRRMLRDKKERDKKRDKDVGMDSIADVADVLG